MRRVLFIISVLAYTSIVSAQSEVPLNDSIKISFDNHISFGEFLIDAELLRAPELPEITHEFMLTSYSGKDYNTHFQLNPKWTYTQENIPVFYSLSHPFGLHSGTEQLQVSTFKLNNGARLSLYGQYNADGYRVPSKSNLPWDKNRFVGGMEVKKGNFGFRLDIQRGGNPYYHY